MPLERTFEVPDMVMKLGWWVIPFIISIYLVFKSMPREDELTDGNFSHIEIDNFIRLFWLIPLGFIWVIYFCLVSFSIINF